VKSIGEKADFVLYKNHFCTFKGLFITIFLGPRCKSVTPQPLNAVSLDPSQQTFVKKTDCKKKTFVKKLKNRNCTGVDVAAASVGTIPVFLSAGNVTGDRNEQRRHERRARSTNGPDQTRTRSTPQIHPTCI
jgi:hypothetical protein